MSRALTIIHLAKYLPSYSGGMEAVTEELACAGVAMGARVVIVGADPGGTSPQPSQHGIELAALPVYGRLGPVPLAPDFFRLESYLQSCDVVHVHLPNPLAEAALLKYLMSTPKHLWPKVVPIMHVGMVRWPRLGRLWEALVQKPLLRRSVRLIAASRELAAGLVSMQGLSAKTDIIPFPTAPAVVQLQPPPSSGMELLAIGRLVKYKGFDLLLEALSGLQVAWKLTIIGAGPERDALVAQCRSLNITSQVNFVGHVSDREKQQRLSSCDILVAPSRTAAEAYGLVIAEAFSYGKPVITTSLATGVAYLARGGQCGAVVPPENTAALRSALQQLLTDPAKRRSCGEGNLRFWQNELTRERFAERYRTTIEALTEEDPKQQLANAS